MTALKHLIEGPIPAESVSQGLSRLQSETSAGACVFFIGRVREDLVDGRTVTGIEYSAYEAMAEPVIQSIKDQLFNEFPDLVSLEIQHSTGLVGCGEISLVVLVSARHRKQLFAALEECIALIKEKLPVWKKEFFSDGSGRWIQ